MGPVLFNFGARDDPNIKIRKSLDEIAMAVEAGDTSAVHTKSIWNIIIQWTYHDDLTEKYAETLFILKRLFWSKKNR